MGLSITLHFPPLHLHLLISPSLSCQSHDSCRGAVNAVSSYLLLFWNAALSISHIAPGGRASQGAFSPSLYWLYTYTLFYNRHWHFISTRIIYIVYKTFNVFMTMNPNPYWTLFHTLHTTFSSSQMELSIIGRLLIHTSLSGYAVWPFCRQLLLLTCKHTFLFVHHLMYVRHMIH